MAPLRFATAVALLFATSVSAAAISTPKSLSALQKRAACAGNTADDRSSWCDFSIDTNWYNEVPDTGVVREYWLDLVEAEVSPDGVTRMATTLNGTVPGPLITADWGDTLRIHVTNNLDKNGTSIHWHGLRQNYTNTQDGVVSITQCAQAPNTTYTYEFRATQYGTTWYHSHYSLQAWDGVFGAIVINGPATANYDTDIEPLVISDWFHESVYGLYEEAQTSGPPTSPNALINGLNVWGDDGSANQTGSRYTADFTSGQTYRLRLVNTAIDSMFKFMIDNHTLTVIAVDLVPVVPFETDIVTIGIAQRYDVLVTANQGSIASDFWLRFIPQSACSANEQANNIRGIIHYDGSTGTPTTTQYDYVDSCEDMALTDLVPHVSIDVPSTHLYEATQDVGLTFNSAGQFRWTINGDQFQTFWDDPTVLQISNNDTSFDTEQQVIRLDEANEWAYIIIETSLAAAHPIHVHGHDFHILAQGDGLYNSSTTSLQLSNPMRRDVAMLPANGHLVLAWETDNPGAWLVHCHIGWHTVEGLAFQFAERVSEIPSIVDTDQMRDTCSTWNAWAEAENVFTDDSGI